MHASVNPPPRGGRLSLGLRAVLILGLLADGAAAAPRAEVGDRGLDDYSVTTWNENDGLNDSRVTAIEQDADGYLWIGTDAGLVRFDGVRFQPLLEAGGTRLPRGSVTALLSATDGSLWIGIMGTPGLARLKDDVLTTYGAEESVPGFPLALLEDRTGAVWAGTVRGLVKFEDGRWQPAGDSPDRQVVIALHEDREGRIWMATRHSVFRRDAAGRFEKVDSLGVASNFWQGFSEDRDGVVWMSDFANGFRRAGDGRAADGVPKGWGVRLLHDRRRTMWVATRGQGLWRVHHPRAGRPLRIDRITAAHGLASDAVQAVFEDREGNIWVGTHAGLQRLTPHRVTPLTDLPVARAMATTPDGSVWVGTTTGLARIRRGNRRQYSEADGLPGAVVLALHAEPNGTLWVSTERGLARMAGNRFSPILVAPSSRLQRLFSIATSDGSLWLRDMSNRLARASFDGALAEADVPEEFRRATLTLTTDRAGRLLIGTAGGRLGIRSPGGHFEVRELGIGPITAIYEDAEGALWVGGEGGLCRLLGEQLLTVTPKNGLPGGFRAIVEDDTGALWVGFASGIARLEREQLLQLAGDPGRQIQYRLFNTADGAAGVPVAEGRRTAVRTPDGRLWFATSGGVTVVDPRRIGDPRPVPRTVIESMKVDAHPVRLRGGDGELTLPPRPSHVQFEFTALTLTDSLHVHFRYRLDGFDEGWVHTSSSRQASYTNLPPGNYRFQVMASNGDNVWSGPTAAVAFRIRPAFYQTGWFALLCLAAVTAAVYLAWHLNARRARQRFALVLAERIRMSRAIHDTLLQGLAGLALELDDLSHGLAAGPATVRSRVLDMRRRVEEHIREARQSIWNLRSPLLDSKPFPDAVRELGLRTIAERPVSLDVTVKGTPRPCSPDVEEQLLHICREALSNAVQHGAPQRVGIEVEYGHERVRVAVSDDGRGFEPSTLRNGNSHYGVISMQERAAQVGGDLIIDSAPGRGTRVETVVPPG